MKKLSRYEYLPIRLALRNVDPSTSAMLYKTWAMPVAKITGMNDADALKLTRKSGNDAG